MANIKVYKKNDFLTSPQGRKCTYMTIAVKQWSDDGETAVIEIKGFEDKQKIGKKDDLGNNSEPDVYRHIEVSGLNGAMTLDEIKTHVFTQAWPIWTAEGSQDPLDLTGATYDGEITVEK